VAEPELRIVLQTGPFTPPDSLVRDLEATSDIQIDQRRLGASFRGGGGAGFIVVTSAADNIAVLADLLHRHTKRLKEKGGDDLFVLLGGRVRTDEEVIGFRDVQCRRQVSLKGKSQIEIREVLEEDAGG